jgi:hypothetical protein
LFGEGTFYIPWWLAGGGMLTFLGDDLVREYSTFPGGSLMKEDFTYM